MARKRHNQSSMPETHETSSSRTGLYEAARALVDATDGDQHDATLPMIQNAVNSVYTTCCATQNKTVLLKILHEQHCILYHDDHLIVCAALSVDAFHGVLRTLTERVSAEFPGFLATYEDDQTSMGYDRGYRGKNAKIVLRMQPPQ